MYKLLRRLVDYRLKGGLPSGTTREQYQINIDTRLSSTSRERMTCQISSLLRAKATVPVARPVV
eukprot:scaffold54191_cov45-Attheya_sp.AAC.3